MLGKQDIRSFGEQGRVLMRADDFIYLLPHPGLREWISNYTITFPGDEPMVDDYTVVPHGSGTMVFECGKNGNGGSGIGGNLFGPVTKACTVGERANRFEMLFIIEFQPAGLYAFTGIKQKELTDCVIPLELVDFALKRQIVEVLEGAESVAGMVRSMDRLLLENRRTVFRPELGGAVRTIITRMGNISVRELADSVYYSERHLNRMFDHYLGMNAKTFSRLVRINQTVRLLKNPGYSVTNVCDLAGFYDSSHFIHDFKAVCGITPQEYRDRMSDFYSEIAKF